MLTYLKSTMRVRRIPMHLSSGHVTLVPGKNLPPTTNFPQSDLGRGTDSCWALPQISIFSVTVKLSVPLLCVCELPGKSVPEMTYSYTVSGGTLNPAHSLTHSLITRPTQVYLFLTPSFLLTHAPWLSAQTLDWQGGVLNSLRLGPNLKVEYNKQKKIKLRRSLRGLM